MTGLGAFLALSGQDRRLLVQAAMAVVVVRAALRFFAADRLRRRVGQARPQARPAERIGWAVRAAARRLPGTTCLASALAAQRLLAREGHVCELTIGVAKNDSAFAAHAWVVCDGQVLVGGDESDSFTPLVAWTSESTARER